MIQAAEVIRRQSKSRDSSAESIMKLKSAETKLSELKSSMLALGREANVAMLSVEDQQQHITFQKLLTTVCVQSFYIFKLASMHCLFSKKFHVFVIMILENGIYGKRSEKVMLI